MIFLFYFVYLASSSIWTFLLFRKSIPAGIDENFYGFIACIEFLSILFIRTRSSFKYAPLLLNFVFALYLYYVKFTLYGYFSLGLSFVMCLSFAYFGLILLVFEIPSLSWNPSYHYTPSIDKPRMLYFPLFSLTSYYDLPHFWSMFYPMHDRSFFTNPQMSLIDRNYLLLNSSFDQVRINHEINNNNNNNPIFNEMHFDVEMQNLLHAQNPNPPADNNINQANNNASAALRQDVINEENSMQQNLLLGGPALPQARESVEQSNQRNPRREAVEGQTYNRME